MPSFEFIEEKRPHELIKDDHLMHNDRFWRVVENYNVLGYPPAARRMLMIVPEQMTSPRGYKFLEIDTEHRIAAYRKTE